MCDVSKFAVMIVLGQRKDNVAHVILYSNKTLLKAHMSCARERERAFGSDCHFWQI